MIKFAVNLKKDKTSNQIKKTKGLSSVDRQPFAKNISKYYPP